MNQAVECRVGKIDQVTNQVIGAHGLLEVTRCTELRLDHHVPVVFGNGAIEALVAGRGVLKCGCQGSGDG